MLKRKILKKIMNKKKKKHSVNPRKFVNYLRTRYFNKKNY